MKAHHFASAVLALAAIACGAALLYLLSKGADADRLLWYAAPALAGTALLGSLRLSAVVRIQLASMVVATGAALYAAEVVLDRAAAAAVPQRKAAEAAGIEFDPRSKLEVVEDLREDGVRAFPAVHGRLFRLERSDRDPLSIVVNGRKKIPLSGPSNQVIVVCNELGDYLTYRSDEYGFHNPPGAWSAGRVEVAAVGDSFTHGACVPTEQGLVARIRASGRPALNLGLDGNGPLAMLGTIREYLPPVQPRVTLWVYYEVNDLLDLEEEKKNRVLSRYLNPGFSQDLRRLQPELSGQLAGFLETALFHEIQTERAEVLKLTNIRTAIGVRGFDPIEGAMPTGEDTCCDLPTFSRALSVARDDVERWGGQLYFVYLPGWRRFFDAKALTPAEKARDEVLANVRRLGIPVVDVHQAFASSPDPQRLFAYPGAYSHYSPIGYELVAETVLAAIGGDGSGGAAVARPGRGTGAAPPVRETS